MNHFELIIKLLEVLAWPVVVATAIIMFRKQLRLLIRSLSRFKYKGLEVDFALEAEKLADEVKEIVYQDNLIELPHEPECNPEEIRDDLINISPRTAVIISFNNVDRAIRAAGIRLGIAKDEHFGVRNTIREMKDRNLIPEQIKSLFIKMRKTRDELTHALDSEITKKDAENFINAAQLLLSFFSKLK